MGVFVNMNTRTPKNLKKKNAEKESLCIEAKDEKPARTIGLFTAVYSAGYGRISKGRIAG